MNLLIGNQSLFITRSIDITIPSKNELIAAADQNLEKSPFKASDSFIKKNEFDKALNIIGEYIELTDKISDSDEKIIRKQLKSIGFAKSGHLPRIKSACRILLAEIYYKKSDASHALKELKIAAKISPNDPLPHIKMAKIYEYITSYGQAIEHYQLAIVKSGPNQGKMNEKYLIEAHQGLSRIKALLQEYQINN